MKISDLLHKVADMIPSESDTEVDVDNQITDAMVPPLQQELELKKKEKGLKNAFDSGQIHEDEIEVLKRLTGL